MSKNVLNILDIMHHRSSELNPSSSLGASAPNPDEGPSQCCPSL